MRINSFFSGLLGALIGGVIVAWITYSVLHPQDNDAPVISKAGAGLDILTDFRCTYGEDKTIIMHGRDDKYAKDGPEPARLHERLSIYPGLSANSFARRDYDEGGLDKSFAEYFDLPANISKGIFVTRFQELSAQKNDTITFGDMAVRNPHYDMAALHQLNDNLSHLEPKWEWTRDDDLYSITFADLKFSTRIEAANPSVSLTKENLLSYLNDGDHDKIIDIFIDEDTIVDFAGMAYCQEPAGKKGLSLTARIGVTFKPDDQTFLTCRDELTQPHCDPFFGDTVCEAELPLACFNSLGEDYQVPPDTPKWAQLWPQKHWSGGEIAYSDPVSGDSFKTVSEANAYCAAQFGAYWRVLEFHDGGSANVAARVRGERAKGRVWVDIKNQPKATCWSR